jgi:hypothetical protein
MVALPSFIVGSVALAMVLIGFVPATATGASMPIVLAAALGMFLATIWAARVGENVSAGITGVFGGFSPGEPARSVVAGPDHPAQPGASWSGNRTNVA